MHDWTMRWTGWRPESQPLREALCTLGNGQIAVRGAFEEARAGGPHYPGTYLAGGYDRVSTEIRGRVLVNEDLVNWPNPLPLTFRAEGGAWLDLMAQEALELEQTLDMRRGVLHRRVVVRDEDGRDTEIVTRRIVAMHAPHLVAIRWEIVPRNWSGRVQIRSGLDGTVENAGVARYSELRGRHLVRQACGEDDHTVWLAVSTHQSRLRMAQVGRTVVTPEPVSACVETYQDLVYQHFVVDLARGGRIGIEKVVAVHTSRDLAGSEPLEDARVTIRHTHGSWAELEAGHARAWASLWRRCDLDLLVARDPEVVRILRLHLFHLLQVVSPNIVDRDVGVPARGLHGEAYRGHIFWDELFIFPLLNQTLPTLTRELLLYRYRRLDAARRLAREQGLCGALYPWQSSSTGREESQVLHLNPETGHWVPDDTHLQRHIAAAVAYNVWSYLQASSDHDFLSDYGAEMLVEIARLYASLASAGDDGRYHIRGVVGPDEFHTRYPSATRPGLDDNAYTNVLASWCLQRAADALQRLPDERRAELLEHLAITGEERRHWEEIASTLYVPFLDSGLIAQFEGYGDLEELDWKKLEERHGDIQRLDRILPAEGTTPNRFKAGKQADVLMLMYLFSADELVEQLATMGYDFDPETIPDHVDYYLARTSHGSTLSRVVHAWVLSRADRARSWHLFRDALQSDVADVQGGTTPEGIHLGAMAGTVDLVRRCYTGASIHEGVLCLDPRLPAELERLTLRFLVAGAWLEVTIEQQSVEVWYSSGLPPRVRVRIAEDLHEIRRNETRRYQLSGDRSSTPQRRDLEEKVGSEAAVP